MMAMVIVAGGKKYMEKVYILYEERENSQLCGIRGVWGEKEKAIAQMKKLILYNNLYTEYSAINYEKGYAESDPMYSEDVYSNYYVQQMEKM